MSKTKLDLKAIEKSLRDVQRDFDRINATLDTPRDPLSDRVLENLLAGYRYLSGLLEKNVDPFGRGSSQHLLKLNFLVLFGDCDPSSTECEKQLALTERRFYDDASFGGIRAFMNYLADHKDDGVWRLAAGAYIQILSEPQMFIEGNHRSGALIMSALLCRKGKPPFVLTPNNAKQYFDPSSLVKSCRKHSLRALVSIPKLRKRLANLLAEQADCQFLQ